MSSDATTSDAAAAAVLPQDDDALSTDNSILINNDDTADIDQANQSEGFPSSAGSLTTPKVDILEETDLSNLSRRITVVTTAALPWRTGTSLNPLMRALYLTKGRPKHHVALLVPWLKDASERETLYGETFNDQNEQEEWIRNYCRTRASATEEEPNLKIMFWNGAYKQGLGSIFPTEDICSLIPAQEADIAILEEPEHLNWWRVPASDKSYKDDISVLGWAHKFKHVVGILHTNYEAYIRQYGWGTSMVTAPALNALSTLVVKAYCHRVIRLSATLPCLDERLEVTSNVHGVRPEFLEATPPNSDEKVSEVYFVGKLIWAKGFDKLLDIQERYKKKNGAYFALDVYGSGEDAEGIKRAFYGRLGTSSFSESGDKQTKEDKTANDVFGKTDSLRVQLCSSDSVDDGPVESEDGPKPFDIIGDLSATTLNTGTETAGAAFRIIESLMENGIQAFGDAKDSASFAIGPAVARFKWRSEAVPARFLGVVDHANLRDFPQQKVFLNMSTTEVLCTTSAEALAMGKFVILPKHRK